MTYSDYITQVSQLNLQYKTAAELEDEAAMEVIMSKIDDTIKEFYGED